VTPPNAALAKSSTEPPTPLGCSEKWAHQSQAPTEWRAMSQALPRPRLRPHRSKLRRRRRQRCRRQ